MDSLNYNYKKGTNQLTQVRDAVGAGNYPNDIDDEPSNRNYQYNTIGELAKDRAGKIDTITWTIYGKVKKIVKESTEVLGAKDSIVFFYNPLGNRLEKRTYTQVYCHMCLSPPKTDTTLYSRDAQGNILAIYDRHKDTVRLSEWDIYGAKRIGTLDSNLIVHPYTPPSSTPLDSLTISYLEGQKQYELTNHLGNVLVTVNDRKLPAGTNVSLVPFIHGYLTHSSLSNNKQVCLQIVRTSHEACSG